MTTDQIPNTEAASFLTASLNSGFGPTTDSSPSVRNDTFSVAASTPIDNDPSAAPPKLVASVAKQERRYALFRMFDPVRFASEAMVNATLNAKYGTRYQGVFAVQFDNPNEITPKTVANFSMTGALLFTPDDIAQYPALKKVRNRGDGVNLSALMTRVKRPTNIDDAAWNMLEKMWADVSTALRTEGITPIHSIVANELAASGCGGPKINKKLGGSGSAFSDDAYDRLCEAIERISIKLQFANQKHS